MKQCWQAFDGIDFLLPLSIILAGRILVAWLAAYRDGKEARGQAQEFPLIGERSYPSISIIIPAWNDYPVLERCLESLRHVDYPLIETIVVAGGTDGTYEKALNLCDGNGKIEVLEQCPRGKNAALNQGYSIAHGEIIVLLDADSVVQPGYLFQLVAALFKAEADAGIGKIVPLVETPVAQTVQMGLIASQEIGGVTILQGAAGIALRREIIEEMGGFPEEVKAGVDWDLDARLAGKKKVFSSQAVVATELPRNFREFYANEVRWRRAHFASLCRFHLQPVRLLASLYIYLLAWGYGIFTLATVIATVFPGRFGGSSMAAYWLVLSAWIFLQRAELPIGVSVYTGDRSLLRLAWVPPMLLLETFAAIIVATLTPFKNDAHFKGPRSLAG